MTDLDIQTVLGPIPRGSLGATDMHEHVIIRESSLTDRDPELLLDDVDLSIREVSDFKVSGGGAIVDMIPIGLGRDIEGLRRVSHAAGVHIVAATGFHRTAHYSGGHWLHHYQTDDIARLIIADLTEGIDRYDYRGPIVERSEGRAGVIKIAGDYQHLSPSALRLAEAAAIAHLETGAPISTHSERGTMLLEQVEVLVEAGVPSERIALGHVDRNPDFAYLKEAAETGASLIFDGASRIQYFPESVLIRVLLDLVEAGYADRIMLGLDFARRSYWSSRGGGPGFGYLLGRFAPRLLQAGMEQSALDVILRDNPARALSWVTPGGDRG